VKTAQVEISKRVVLINSASNAAIHLINISVLLWLNRYLLRRISPEEYSIYPVVMSVVVFVPLFTTILTSGLSRYILEAYARNDEQRVKQIVSTMFPLLLITGAALLSLGWTFSWYIGNILTIAPGRLWDARIMMGLLMFSAAVQLPAAPFSVGFFVRQKYVLLNCIQLCLSILRVAILLILLFCVSTRVLWVVISSVSVTLCGLFVNVVISRRLVPALKFQICDFNLSIARPLISFGTWNFFIGLAYRIRHNSDVIVLNKLAGSIDVTIFHVGNLFWREISTILEVLSGPMMPALTALHAQGAKERLKNAFLRVGRFSLWLGLFFAVPLMILSREFILLYVGQKYINASMVLVLALAIFPIGLGSIMVWRIAQATGEVRPIGWRIVVTQIINLGVTLVLVGYYKMGAVGAALSSFVIGTISSLFLTWPLSLRMVDVSFHTCIRKTLIPGLLPAAVTAIIIYGLKTIASPASWGLLALYAAVGCMCYVTVLWSFCLSSQDKKDMYKILSKIKYALKTGWNICRVTLQL